MGGIGFDLNRSEYMPLHDEGLAQLMGKVGNPKLAIVMTAR